MCKIIQLSIPFEDVVRVVHPVSCAVDSPLGGASRAPRGMSLNPCSDCPMFGMCDSDECGMLLHEIDVPKEDLYKHVSFEDWLDDWEASMIDE